MHIKQFDCNPTKKTKTKKEIVGTFCIYAASTQHDSQFEIYFVLWMCLEFNININNNAAATVSLQSSHFVIILSVVVFQFCLLNYAGGKNRKDFETTRTKKNATTEDLFLHVFKFVLSSRVNEKVRDNFHIHR